MSAVGPMRLSRPVVTAVTTAMAAARMRKVGLSKASGCHMHSIRKVCHGELVDAGVADAVARALGVAEDVLFESVEMPPEVKQVPFLPDRIRLCIEIAGITVAEVSRRMGRHETNLAGKFIKNNSLTTERYLRDFCDAVGLPYDLVASDHPGADDELRERLRLKRERTARREERIATARQEFATARERRKELEVLRQRAIILRNAFERRVDIRGLGYRESPSDLYAILAGRDLPLTDGRLELLGIETSAELRPSAAPTAIDVPLGGGVSFAFMIAEAPSRRDAFEVVLDAEADDLDAVELRIAEAERAAERSSTGKRSVRRMPSSGKDGRGSSAGAASMLLSLVDATTAGVRHDGSVFCLGGHYGSGGPEGDRFAVVCADPDQEVTWVDEDGSIARSAVTEGLEFSCPTGRPWIIHAARADARAVLSRLGGVTG